MKLYNFNDYIKTINNKATLMQYKLLKGALVITIFTTALSSSAQQESESPEIDQIIKALTLKQAY